VLAGVLFGLLNQVTRHTNSQLGMFHSIPPAVHFMAFLYGSQTDMGSGGRSRRRLHTWSPIPRALEAHH
jgi:hypothetical protein